MRPGYGTAFLTIGLILLAAISSAASAGTSGYCLECHPRRFLQTVRQDLCRPVDDRSVYSLKLHPCPGLRSLSEEVFFTESRIVKLEQILRVLEKDGWKTNGFRRGVSELAESLQDLKGREKVSVRQVSKEASAIRAVLQKIYERTVHARSESSRRWLIGLGCLFLLGLLVLIGLGYRKLGRMGKALCIYIVIGGMVGLTATACSPPEAAKKSPDQERLERSLSVATEITGQMEETFYQSCLLAEMSREWAKIEPAAAERGFQLAWQMSLGAREKATQLKGLKEIASRWPDQARAVQDGVRFDTVLDLRDELQSGQGRTWALRAVSEEWVQVNPKGGRSALEFATREALAMEGSELRDRELGSLVSAWADIDGPRSIEIARAMKGPFLKSLALTRTAFSGSDKGRAESLLKEAWKTAEAIPPSFAQSKAMIEIAISASRFFPQEKNSWLDRTLLQLQRLTPDALKAFAVQDLVLHWASIDLEQAKRLAMEIPSTCPEERAYALIYLARSGKDSKPKALTLLREASAEMRRISDPFQAQKVKGEIGKEMVDLDPGEALKILPQIESSFYQSEVLGALALKLSPESKRKALDLIERISEEPLHTDLALTVVDQWMDREKERVASFYREAFQTASAIGDPYTKASFLIELGKNWNRIERGKGQKLLEPVLASAERIFSPPMRNEIIEAIAEGIKKDDPARAELLLNGIEPSVFRIRKAFEEVQRWTTIDPRKARELAEAFPVEFPFDKARAFREVAGGLKKTEPRLAFEFYERAIEQILALPEEDKGRRILPSLVGEATLLDKERTVQRILRMDASETRNALLREVGNRWVKEDPLFALKTAQEISEGSLRLALYQRIADYEAKRVPGSRRIEQDQADLLALAHWGSGREKAKKDELKAVPYYEKALREIKRINDPRARSFLVSSLASEWAVVDEQRALQVAETIAPDFPEPLSYALFQIGNQFHRWNRKEAESLFQRAVLTAGQIQEPRLKAKRLFEVGKQWQGTNQGKGREVLRLAEKAARERIFHGNRESLLAEILVSLSIGSQDRLDLFQDTDSPSLRARVLLEQARIESKRTVEENAEILERALPYAQKAKDHRILSEEALLWYALDQGKGLEICGQIGSDELRVRTLCKMAQKIGDGKGGESKLLMEKAVQESLRIRGATEKVRLLKEIAGILATIDKEQAKSVYQIAYQVMRRSTL